MSSGATNLFRVIRKGLSDKWQLRGDLKEVKEIMVGREHSRGSSECRDPECVWWRVLCPRMSKASEAEHVRGRA